MGHLGGIKRSDLFDFEKSHKRACKKENIESIEQSKKGGQLK